MSTIELIVPQWPAPPRVRAVSTLRSGGVSAPPYDTLNLGEHVGDEPDSVAENRRRLCEQLGIDEAPYWLDQVHGTRVVRAGAAGEHPSADAAFADEPNRVCAVLTADCLPILLARTDGRRVAAVHCGWRGLSGGVLESTIAALETPPRELLAWLGPAIGLPISTSTERASTPFSAADVARSKRHRPSSRFDAMDDAAGWPR